MTYKRKTGQGLGAAEPLLYAHGKIWNVHPTSTDHNSGVAKIRFAVVDPAGRTCEITRAAKWRNLGQSSHFKANINGKWEWVNLDHSNKVAKLPKDCHAGGKTWKKIAKRCPSAIGHKARTLQAKCGATEAAIHRRNKWWETQGAQAVITAADSCIGYARLALDDAQSGNCKDAQHWLREAGKSAVRALRSKAYTSPIYRGSGGRARI